MSRAYPSGAYYGVLPGSARFITSKRPEKNFQAQTLQLIFASHQLRRKKLFNIYTLW